MAYNDNACCDLLSENCIFEPINNPEVLEEYKRMVVICFQKIVSLNR